MSNYLISFVFRRTTGHSVEDLLGTGLTPGNHVDEVGDGKSKERDVEVVT